MARVDSPLVGKPVDEVTLGVAPRLEKDGVGLVVDAMKEVLGEKGHLFVEMFRIDDGVVTSVSEYDLEDARIAYDTDDFQIFGSDEGQADKAKFQTRYDLVQGLGVQSDKETDAVSLVLDIPGQKVVYRMTRVGDFQEPTE